MTIIWVTGTNGKTTSSNIIARWLQESWKKVFMFTTANVIVNDETFTNYSKMTSPSPFELQKWFQFAKKQGCDIAVIETASHGILMHRIWGIDYDISVLTNITQDHLDLHRTMENYVNTKLKIFSRLMYYKRKKWVKKTGIINNDSAYKQRFIDQTYDSLFTYGMKSGANIAAKNIKNTRDAMMFTAQMPGKNIEVKTALRWDFNIYNILAAIGVFASLWIEKEQAEKAIANIECVPWRMEEVKSKDNFSVFIDYAHTPDALGNVLSTLSKIQWKWRIITVFWATWDRDKAKRPLMGQTVSEYSDVVIVTQDDDYSENTQKIIKDILPWIDRKQWEDFWIIPDRKEAIRTALVMAQKEDIILLAGKWDEHAIITNNWPIEYHEKTLVEQMLKEIDDNTILK